jgi:hypothetical protein
MIFGLDHTAPRVGHGLRGYFLLYSPGRLDPLPLVGGSGVTLDIHRGRVQHGQGRIFGGVVEWTVHG